MARNDIYLELQPAPTDTDDSTEQLFSFGDMPVKYMSGFYKTVIHWAKCFLTGRGEDISDPTYGTIIGSMIGVGNGNLAEVRDLVYISVGQATSKIQEYQTRINDLTLSEKLVSAEIEDFSQPSADEFKLSIRLRNASGELLLMRLPIDVTSRRA